ncbi:MAG: GIY-YIG nuclease family protein [Gammaproteobacteria bacterium]|jgi:putative endonuclease|nr:GIY-YIG nuclease family protein [Gammaproteobacteria bacterium]
MSTRHCTYILASKRNGALYVGVTADLVNCVLDHKCNLVGGMTRQYAINQLVYFEWLQDAAAARRREQEIRQLHRIWKLDLIEQQNPHWRDLYADISSSSCYPAA